MMFPIILVVLSVPIIPQLLWILTVFLFAFRRSSRITPPVQASTKFKVLIPAHNEDVVIAKCIKSLKLIKYPADLFSITVIADNCSDRTAKIVAQHDVDVWERTSTTRKSKGYALEDAFNKYTRNNEYDAFVIIDADTEVSANILSQFDCNIANGYDWIQGYYSGSNVFSGWRTQLMEWGFAIFNGVYMKGLSGMGLSVPLRGNGMCFSTKGLHRVPWRCSGLAEDMEFSWELRLKGEKVIFNRGIHVKGEFVSAGESARSQRQRWEEGRNAVRRQYMNRISELAFSKQLPYFLDLKMWPLGRIVGYLFALSILSIVLTGALTQFIVAMWVTIFLYGLSPTIFGFCSAKILISVIHVPKYIVWKAFLKLKKGPATWVRTKREGEKQ